MVKKLLKARGLVIVLIALYFFAPSSVLAANYPDPLPITVPIMHGSYWDGWLSDVGVSLSANKNKGYFSSRRVSYQDGALFSTEKINPYTVVAGSSIRLIWNMASSIGKNVTGCTMNISSQDSDNSYSMDASLGNASGSKNFDTSPLQPGNYMFKMSCDIEIGLVWKDKYVLNDFVYFYLIPSNVKPAPIYNDFLINSSSADGVKIRLSINDNDGIVSSTGLSGTGVITGADPLGFVSGQPFNLRVSMSGEKGWKKFAVADSLDINSLMAQLIRLPIPLGIFPSDAGWVYGCSINVHDEDNNKKITTIAVPEYPGINKLMDFPVNLPAGNYSFALGCTLGNSKNISDIMYVYRVGGAGPIPTHLDCVSNVCSIAVGLGPDSCAPEGSACGGLPPQCSDAKDNDSDGKIDFPADPGCSSPADNNETDAIPPPTVNININGIAGSSPIINGNAGTINWTSANATTCTASGSGWSGARGVSGSESTGVLTFSKVYDITCTGIGGTRGASVTAAVTYPGGGPFVDIKIQ